MGANGQKAELFSGGEFGQTHGAVEGIIFCNGVDVVVEEHGQRVDEGLVEPGVVEVEELPQLTLKRAGVDG